MSTIRCIYKCEPTFPATDQHPDAVRYKVGAVWVDALDGEPTQQEIDAVLNPAPAAEPPSEIKQLADMLAGKGVITPADAATFEQSDKKR